MKKPFLGILTLFVLLYYQQVFAQNEDKRWAVSLHGGTAIMQGDGEVGNLSAAGGIGFKYSLANNFSVRLQMMGGSMESKNLGDLGSLYKTTTSFFESNIQALLNIVNFKNANTGKNIAQLYVGIGVGYTSASISYSRQKPDGEPASLSTIIVPFSAGMRFYINPLIDVGLEYSIKASFTDHLDGYLPTVASNKSNDYYNMPQAYITFNLGRIKSARNIEWTEQTEKIYDELIKAKQDAQQQIDALKQQNQQLLNLMGKDLKDQMANNQRKADSSLQAIMKFVKNDKDDDGVSDVFDKEPNSPAGAIVDGSGRTMDVDKDGVPDYLDKCPTVPGKASNFGCPIQATKVQLATISDGIKYLQFETGNAIIKPSSFPALNALAKMLLDNPTFGFLIEGHTDNVGDSKENLTLSLQRANAVKSYLVSKGVEASRITANGYGDTRPIVSNDTAAGKAKNRRVDMTIE